jgi:putative acetyltransferase
VDPAPAQAPAPPPPRPFTLRTARDDDGEAFVTLLSACWGEYDGMVLDPDDEMAHLNRIATHYAGLRGFVWLAERHPPDSPKPIVAGSVAWRPTSPGVVELQLLYVMPEARRKGLASYLVRMVEDHVAGSGVETLELWSDTRFADAHRLYRSLGWDQLDETRVLDDLSKSTEIHFRKVLGRRLGAGDEVLGGG